MTPQTKPRQAASPHSHLDPVYDLLAQFTPLVCPHKEQFSESYGWLAEISASARLFGGQHPLLKRIWKNFAHLFNQCNETTVQMACHPNPAGAWYKAKHKPANCENDLLIQANHHAAVFDCYPLHVLDVPDHTLNTLMQCGLNTVEALQALPRQGLQKRFGSQLLAQIDALHGQISGTFALNAYSESSASKPAPYFKAAEELPFHSMDVARIEQATDPLIKQLCSWMQQRQLATVQLDWVFNCHGQHVHLNIQSRQASAQAKGWARLMHLHLGQLQFPDEVCSVELECTQLSPQPASNLSLLLGQGNEHGSEHTSDTEAWASLCDTLQARLGPDAVRSGQNMTPQLAPTQSVSSPRPLWLLPKPLALQGIRPAWAKGGAWQLVAGPERIELGWWQNGYKRDYYCALNAQFGLVWLFQDLDNQEPGKAWFLHGYFA